MADPDKNLNAFFSACRRLACAASQAMEPDLPATLRFQRAGHVEAAYWNFDQRRREAGLDGIAMPIEF